MSGITFVDEYGRSTVYTDGSGRRVIRHELIGREGGTPPILINWKDFETGELLGTYSCPRWHGEPITSGPMFGKPL